MTRPPATQSDAARFKAMLDRAGIPYEEDEDGTVAVGGDDQAASVFGLGGGYVGVFRFAPDGTLVGFGVMV